jgi:hypothetical protein
MILMGNMDGPKLAFFTRRHGTEITLNLKLIETGRQISHMDLSADPDKEGAPLLQSNFEREGQMSTIDVGGFVGFIWDQLQHGDIGADREQQLLDEVGKWISKCETPRPVRNKWNG